MKLSEVNVLAACTHTSPTLAVSGAVRARQRRARAQVVADVMGAEAALCRAQFVSGTHAIATALFTALRPGDELLAIAGKPYDTLEEVIGLRGTPGAHSAHSVVQQVTGSPVDCCPTSLRHSPILFFTRTGSTSRFVRKPRTDLAQRVCRARQPARVGSALQGGAAHGRGPGGPRRARTGRPEPRP